MTLIDAEALYKHFAELEEEARNKYISTTNEIEKSWWSIVLTERTAYKHDVADAPTIEPRRGRWINHRKDRGHNIADCDQCGGTLQWLDPDEKPNFCPDCGADMREVSE